MTMVVMVIVLGASAVWGQITITSDEIPTQFGYQMYEYMVYDTTGAGIAVNPGPAGGPQNWSFTTTAYPNGFTELTDIVDPATTAFASEFSDADFAYHTAGDSGDVFYYLKNTTTELEGLGYGLSGSPVPFVVHYNPPEIWLTYPLTMGTSWHSETADTTGDPSTGTLLIDRRVSDVVVDAYGTITLPIGTFDCLRLRSDDVDYSTVVFNGVPMFTDSTVSISYSWVGKNVGWLADITSQDGETNPNFTVAGDVSFRVNGAQAITDDEKNLPSDFEVSQNYPNPFNPSTTISFYIPRASNVQLSVFDVTGRVVQSISMGMVSAGQHQVTINGSDLPSGIYFYRLTAGTYQATKRMVLMK